MIPLILPLPRTVTPGEGRFTLSAGTRISAGPGTELPAQHLRDWLTASLGALDARDDAGSIQLAYDAAWDLGDEGYRIEVTPDAIRLSASAPAGLFYAVQTLRQLAPADAEGGAAPGTAWAIPAVSIEDEPRFRWRGLMLDVGRHFFPASFVRKFIDVMASYKFNTLHLHLTEDQGWRIEIKRYPRLTEVGARRAESVIPEEPRFDGTFTPKLDGTPYGGFYTQEELRELVAYAAARFVTIVPEIEMPGHALAALASYPELGCVGHGYQVRTTWGIADDVYCAGKETTYTFIEHVLEEVLDIFPSPYIHIGGDECHKDRWHACPHCQAVMAREGLLDEEALQSYFVRRAEAMLNARGRRLIGWDEILEGGLAPNATVMSWRGSSGGITAATAGHDVVMTPDTHCYLDHSQAQDRTTEPPAFPRTLLLETAYAFDPLAGIPADKAGHVLGGQGNIWTEYMETERHVEYMVFPRALALADALWRWQAEPFDAFRARLNPQLTRLERRGVNFRRPQPL